MVLSRGFSLTVSMMATRSDSAFAPKKKITTYGKSSRQRSLGSSSSGTGIEGPSATQSRLSQPQAKDDDAVTRQPTTAVSKPKPIIEKRPVRPSNAQGGASAATERTTYRDAGKPKEAHGGVKRKPSQVHAETRQPKKQRSSSPDSSPLPPPATKKTEKGQKSLSGPPDIVAGSGPTTPPTDIVMEDAQKSSPFSPATFKALDTLSVANRKAAMPQRQIPFRPPNKIPAKHGSAPTKGADKSATKKENRQPPAQPRRRLIDALAAQAEGSSEEEDDDDDEMEGGSQGTPQNPGKGPFDDDDLAAALDRLTPVPTSPGPNKTTLLLLQTPLTTKKPGVKFTYNQQRTMLAEDPIASLAGPQRNLFSEPLIPESQSSLDAFTFDDESEDGPAKGAVQSIHELRQAGANNRFSDELDDTLDRIGLPPPNKPSSTRRGALIELCEKLQDKAFLRQFRDHGGEASLCKTIGKESDVIAGYVLGCILVSLLANSPSPHTVQLLRTEGIADLLTLLLSNDDDIVTIAKDRKSNVSKRGQMSISKLQSTIQQHPLWEQAQSAPSHVSSRTLGLKCLELIINQSPTVTDRDDIMSPAVTEQLFEIVSSASNSHESAYWDFPNGDKAMDLYLSLALLEIYSVAVMQSGPSTDWTGRYLPIIARILETALRRTSSGFGDLECLVLKLTMNIANNNPVMQELFLQRGLLGGLVAAACETFEVAVKTISGDDFSSATLDSLVLMLGVMINFSEDDPSAGSSLLGSGRDSALDRLIKIFLNYRSSTTEADSVEKSRLNVAFGYLSVLLGYLALYGPIQERFGSLHSGGDLGPLLGSLREFIAYNKAVDFEIDEGNGVSFTGRLQSLVSRLERPY